MAPPFHSYSTSRRSDPPPPTVASYAEEAFTLVQRERAAEAIEVARAALQVHPRSPELLLALGRAMFIEGDVTGARRVLLEGTLLAPGNADLCHWLARAMLHLDEYERAIYFLQRAIQHGGIDDEVAELYARAHLGSEQKKRSRSFLDQG